MYSMWKFQTELQRMLETQEQIELKKVEHSVNFYILIKRIIWDAIDL